MLRNAPSLELLAEGMRRALDFENHAVRFEALQELAVRVSGAGGAAELLGINPTRLRRVCVPSKSHRRSLAESHGMPRSVA